MTAKEPTPRQGQDSTDAEETELPDGLLIRPWVSADAVRLELELPAGEATISLSREEADRVARAVRESVEYLEFVEDQEEECVDDVGETE